MHVRMQLYATMIIWTAFTVMTIVLFATNSSAADSGNMIPLVGTLAGAAAIGTFSVWVTSGSKAAESAPSAGTRREEKPKRVDRDRLERLLNRMDDDELLDLQDMLLEREHDASAMIGGHRR